MHSRIRIHDETDMVAHLEKSINRSHPHFDLNAGIYLNGVNCQGVHRSGIAAAYNRVFPIVQTLYGTFITAHFAREYHNDKFIQKKFITPDQIRGGLLGKVGFVELTTNHLVANCFTQYDYGRARGHVYVDYEAIARCMRAVNANQLSHKGVHFPMIGAGLGGGVWSTVEEIILDSFDKHKPLHLYLYQPQQKDKPTW